MPQFLPQSSTGLKSQLSPEPPSLSQAPASTPATATAPGLHSTTQHNPAIHVVTSAVRTPNASLGSHDRGPPYTLNHRIHTVADIWTEFARGLGGPALSKLIAEKGMTWRDPNVIKRTAYHDRKVVWEAIVRLGIHMGVSNDCAARWMQEYFVKAPTENGTQMTLHAFRGWLKHCLSKAKEENPRQDAKQRVAKIYVEEMGKVMELVKTGVDVRTAKDISDVNLCAEIMG